LDEKAPAQETAGTADVAALVRRAQAKDPSAFTDLIRRYERTALSIAYAVLGDADRAGEVVQEAFVRAWERLADLNDPDRFGPWLCGVVRNLATDVRRRQRLAPKAETDVLAARNGQSDEGTGGLIAADPLATDPLDELGRREQHRLVAEALDGLDEQTRTAVVMRYFEDRSSKEIGQLLGLSPAAVDMRLSRARQQLKQRLLATQAF